MVCCWSSDLAWPWTPHPDFQHPQLECNGSLSRVNTRVEKYSPVKVGATSSTMAPPSSAPTAHAGPRALETASQIRQDTLTRQQDKEAKLWVPHSRHRGQGSGSID